ncbi:MAG: MerR family transcriptional regulator [Chloroflexota bacterium]
MADQRQAAVYAMCVVRDLTGLSDRQIRYYDQVGLVVPVRTASGRRLYSPAQIDALLEVKALIDEGLTVVQTKAALERRRRRPSGVLTAREPDVETRRDAMIGPGTQRLSNTAYVERRLGEMRPKR